MSGHTLRNSVRRAIIGSLLAGVGACASGSYRTPSPPPSSLALLEARLPRLIDSAGIPGISIAVVMNGSPVWNATAGVRQAGGKNAVTSRTVFEAASLSKPVLAYMVMRLVDERKLSLDEPLSRYLPLADLADQRKNAITARMVLSHTTGLQNERIGSDTLALAFNPGSAYRYSGEAYTYLGHVLESITREPLDRLARRLVFDPLGMSRSAFVWEERFADDAATGHGSYTEMKTPSRPTVARAAATLHTTATDYALFLGAVASGKGLSAASRDALMTPISTAADGVQWAAGWGVEKTPTGSALWHHGDNSLSGFTAFAWLDPKSRNGLVYFANSTTGLSIAREMLAALNAGAHPAIAWINYEPFDSPARSVRMTIYRVALRDGASAAIDTYRSLKTSQPRSAFTEGLLNGLGYRFLSLNKAADAVVFFEENVRGFPQSANVYDSLGDGLSAAGRTAEAIAAYVRSVELDPRNTHAVDRIRQLRR